MSKKLLTTARTWLLISAICLSTLHSTAQSPGFFLDDWHEKTASVPEYVNAEKPTETPTVTVTVDHSQFINKVPQYIYGNNAVTWDSGLPENPTAMTDLKNLNPNVLRWPGGSLSNSYFWNVPYGQRPADIPNDISPWYGMNTTWQLSVDEYYELLEETGSTGSICVNYSYARYGTSEDPVATAAHMAAEWVRYDNGRSKYWEIGNENFGNWEVGNIIDTDLNQDGQPAKISGTLYGQHASVFIDSMRAAASEVGADIKIGVVTYDAETSHDPISEVWNEGMMPIVGDKADFLIVHNYFTPYNQDSPVSTVLNSHTVPGSIMSAVEADMAEAGKTMLPVAMTEWNIFAVGSMQQVSYINGMLAAMTLGEFVKNNYGMGNRWDLVNGWSNGNDHGMFSSGGEPGVEQYNPRAVFFYMYYHQKFFGDSMVGAAVSGNNNIVAHASTFSSGETGLVLVNKGRDAEIAEIEIENGDPGLQYYYYTLTGGDDNGDFSRKVLINGIETDEQGGGPDEYASIKAKASYSHDGIVVELPPLSAVYLMVERKVPLTFEHATIDTNNRIITAELSGAVQPADNPGGFEVMLNGTSVVPVSQTVIDADHPFLVHLYLEQDIINSDVLTVSYSGNELVDSDGIQLAEFSDEPVENLLPGGPYDVTVVTRTSEGVLLQGAEVELNGTTQLTNAEGEASFSVMEGTYALSGTLEHYTMTSGSEATISSPTVLYMEFTEKIYNVTFHVTDANSGSDMNNVHITFVDGFITTNSEGNALLDFAYGSLQVSIGKFNYSTLDSTIEVISDLTLEIALERSHSGVKFRIKNGASPVVDATVILNGETLATGPAGTITFESVPVDTEVDYSVEKENFYTLTGSMVLDRDTTVNLQMEKTIANVTFVINGPDGPPGDAYVILEGDSCSIGDNEQCFYYGLDKDVSYDYKAGATGFETVTGSILLERDTTLQLLLTPVSSPGTETQGEFRVYPNPSHGQFTITALPAGTGKVSVLDMTGNIVFSKNIEKAVESVKIDLPVPAGIYFIKTRENGNVAVRKLVIR